MKVRSVALLNWRKTGKVYKDKMDGGEGGVGLLTVEAGGLGGGVIF